MLRKLIWPHIFLEYYSTDCPYKLVNNGIMVLVSFYKILSLATSSRLNYFYLVYFFILLLADNGVLKIYSAVQYVKNVRLLLKHP